MSFSRRLIVVAGVLLALAGCADGPTTPPVPQLNPLPGAKLTSAFGARSHDPVTGQALVDGHHDGYDLAAPMGSPIRASKAGKVTFAGTRGGYGNAVILEHAGGWSTLYGHASKLVVKPGQYVQAGQVIAYVGSTGHSTGPHLHYELRHNGMAVDPALGTASKVAKVPGAPKLAHKGKASQVAKKHGAAKAAKKRVATVAKAKPKRKDVAKVALSH